MWSDHQGVAESHLVKPLAGGKAWVPSRILTSTGGGVGLTTSSQLKEKSYVSYTITFDSDVNSDSMSQIWFL